MAGIDTYTKLMLHMDGTNGSTTFTDSEITPKTMTAVGNAQISTAQSKFGGASGLFDGTGDRVTTPDATDFDLGTGKFTIDFWVRTSTAGYQWISGQATDGSNFWGVVIRGTGSDNITFGSLTGAAWDVNFNCTGTVTDGNWHHIAVVRDGTTSGTWHLFLDGTELTKTLAVGAYNGTVYNSASVFSIGGNSGGTFGSDLNGYIDEFRFSLGIARWTSNFTPPTIAYTLNATNTNGAFLMTML